MPLECPPDPPSPPDGLFVADLLSRRGLEDGETVYCAGWHGVQDPNEGTAGQGNGSAGTFVWDADNVTAGDGGIVIRPGATIVLDPTYNEYHYQDPAITPGAWVRNREDKALVDPRWFGCYASGFNTPLTNNGIGVVSDTYALEAAIRALPHTGGRLRCLGRFSISRAIKFLNNNPGGAGRWDVTVEGGGVGGAARPSRFIWEGPAYWNGATPVAAPNGYTGSFMVTCAVSTVTFRGISFDVAPGKHCGTLFNLGFSPGDTVDAAVTSPTFEFCQFAGNGPLLANGTCDYAFAMDIFEMSVGNMENNTFKSCIFGAAKMACVFMLPSTQPFATSFQDCHLHNLTMHSTIPTGAYGIGLLLANPNCNVNWSGGSFQRVAVPLLVYQPVMSLTVDGVDTEQSKKLLYGMGALDQTLSTITVNGGRYAVGALQEASEGSATFPSGTVLNAAFPAGDVNYIDLGGTGTLRLNGCNFSDGYSQKDFKVRFVGLDVYSTGCIYPNLSPFKRLGSFGMLRSGRTFSRGDKGQALVVDGGGSQDYVPVLQGAESHGGKFAVSSGTTSVAVVLSVPELRNDYKVRFSVDSVLGTPTIGEARAESLTTTGFTAVVSAPSSGTVTYKYELYRDGVPDDGLRVLLSAVSRWRASDAVVSGGNLVSVPNLISGGPSLLPLSVTAQPVAVSQLNNNVGALGRSSAALSYTPTNGITLLFVAYEGGVGALSGGCVCTTVGGVAATGQQLLKSGGSLTSLDESVSRASTPITSPGAFVAITTIRNGQPVRLYLNSKTPIVGTAADATPATDTLVVNDTATAPTSPSTLQQWSEIMVFNKDLASSEINALLDEMGSKYGIAISP